MKTKIKYIVLFISLFNLVFISHDIIAQTAFKGIELNSWLPASDVWRFSLLMGTNRTKTIQEITDPKVTIIGVNNLKKKLSELPKGENVYWMNYAKEPVPKKIINELLNYSKSIEINLHLLL